MEAKPGTPEPDKEQQDSDEEELEDLKAPSDSQEEVAGGCAAACSSFGSQTCHDGFTYLES